MWGHVIQNCANGRYDFFANPVFKVIYAFHMPLFMAVSGYLFFFSQRKRGFSEMARHRISGLIAPIVSGAVLYYYAQAACDAAAGGGWKPLFAGEWHLALDRMWFLWSTLAASLIVGALEKARLAPWARIALSLVSAPLVCLLPRGELSLFVYPYFLAGFWFAKHRERIPAGAARLVKWASFALFPPLVYFFKSRFFVYRSGVLPFGVPNGFADQIMIDAYRYLTGFAGVVCALCAISWLYRALKDRPPVAWACRLGERSLQIYVLQTVLLELLFRRIYEGIGSDALTRNMPLFDAVYAPLLAAGFALATAWLARGLERMRIGGLIFGRSGVAREPGSQRNSGERGRIPEILPRTSGQNPSGK